jgi:DNA-binding NtrC family response regulator
MRYFTVFSFVASRIEVLNNEIFDVALIDYDLDDGKGDEFIQHVKKLCLNLPMVACSSHDFGNNTMSAAGANVICAKLNFKDIALVIKKCLELKAVSKNVD